MLANPSHPPSTSSAPSLRSLPLARPMQPSSRPRPPLGSLHTRPQTVRDPSPPLHAKRDRPLSAHPTSSTTVDAPRPRLHAEQADKENARRREMEQQERDKQQQQQQQQGKEQLVENKKKDAAAPSRAKLTEQWGEPPSQIRRENCWLQRGELLGEGGFARVYLCTEPDGITYKALKVIDKQQLKSTKTKSKLFAEIKIHQAMQHPNIIAFEHCFEDDSNVYMQLELCSNGSLLDLLRLRRRYSEPEARFYLTQLVGACDYMHANSVIHRDLKLGNLMLDENMDLRVGDFGLAALVKFPGERKKTICGTPNYIAPEILFDQKAGHSFEVDIWSIGVILYTLLIGRPPFQTKDVKNIYRKIRDNAYTFPSDHCLSPESLDLISWILRPSPSERPSLAEILAHPWFVTGPFPSRVSPRAADPAKAGDLVEEWRYMTKRQARQNFKRVKRRAGIVEVEEAQEQVVQPMEGLTLEGAEEQPHEHQLPPPARSSAKAHHPPAPALVSQALPAVAEAVEEGSSGSDEDKAAKTRTKQTMRLVKREEEKEAKGRIEKEVRKATAPESPISELLRSARKPLMVSPSSRAPPPPSISSAAFPSSSRSHQPTTSSSLASAPPQQPAFSRTASGSERERTTSGSSRASSEHRERERDRLRPSSSLAPPPPSSAPTSSSSSSSGTSLYDLTRLHFDHFLPVRSSSALQSALSTFPSLSSAASQPLVDEPEIPKVFLTSWVDYTHKYGTAYSLTDGTAGVYFNDSTSMVLSPGKEHFDYITSRRPFSSSQSSSAQPPSSSSSVYLRKSYSLSPSSTGTFTPEIDRKAYLLRYFEDYMAKTLRRDVHWAWEDTGRTKNMDFLVKYYRMKNAIVFKLSNEVLQFNFYDHTKLVLTRSGLHLTFISPSFTLTTYSLPYLFRLAASLGHYSSPSSSLPEEGTEERNRLEEVRFLIEKVEYCREVLKQLGERRRERERAKKEAAAGAGAEERTRKESGRLQ
ncbi:hypothetical protein JCM8547_000523 [Rhodosporidiobolus lusitaniae]